MDSPDPENRPHPEPPRPPGAPGDGTASRGPSGSSGSGGDGEGGAGRRTTAGRRAGEAGGRLGGARRRMERVSRNGADQVTSASRRTARVAGGVGRATGRRIRGLTGAQGAGESGLSRLIELGAVNAAADTALAVSLAGTVFFTVPSEQARDRVALFLLLTMAPFALMAPLIGPVLDRFRHGRRWAIGATLGLRGFLVWSLAASMGGGNDTSVWLYPAALGCLVASKAYGVTRASAVPRLLPPAVSLVTANSRISLAGVAGATIGAGIAAAFAAIGPEWSLRWAALVYAVGLVLAIRLPTAVDSPAGEELVGQVGRQARKRAVTAAVARGIRCNLGLRFVSGFLTMYLAFLLRDHPISGLDGALAAGAVVAAAGIGNSLGTLCGSLLRARKPEKVVLAVLLADAAVALVVAVLYGFPTLIVLGLVAGLCSSLGKLSLDAMIQRDVPETVRTSVFARSETVLQLSWVIGGGFGIVLPLIPRLGFGFLAAVLAVVVAVVLRYRPKAAPDSIPDLTPGTAPTPDQPTPPSGRWWGGRPDDEKTTVVPTTAARADDTTVVRPVATDRTASPQPVHTAVDLADQPTAEHPVRTPDPADDTTVEQAVRSREDADRTTVEQPVRTPDPADRTTIEQPVRRPPRPSPAQAGLRRRRGFFRR